MEDGSGGIATTPVATQPDKSVDGLQIAGHQGPCRAQPADARGVVPGDRRFAGRRAGSGRGDADREAQFALADADREKAHGHLAEARRLVEETGYGRRRPEVEALEPEVG
jgi:hypothetical protein